MENYRLLRLRLNGEIDAIRVRQFADNKAALTSACAFADGDAFEVWRGNEPCIYSVPRGVRQLKAGA